MNVRAYVQQFLQNGHVIWRSRFCGAGKLRFVANSPMDLGSSWLDGFSKVPKAWPQINSARPKFLVPSLGEDDWCQRCISFVLNRMFSAPKLKRMLLCWNNATGRDSAA